MSYDYIGSTNLPSKNADDEALGALSVIGRKGDAIQIPYEHGENSIAAHLCTQYYHVHGESFVYPKYANNVTLTSAAGAYATTGNITEIIPADTLVSIAGESLPFDVHFVDIVNISAVGKYVIDIYTGAAGEEVLISSTTVSRGSTFSQEIPKRIQIPQQPAGTRISAKLTSSPAGANTLDIALEGHFYG